MVGGRYLCQHFQFRNAQKLIFQPQRLVFRTFCSICEYLGPPSQPPMFLLWSMRFDCYED